jgi:YfiH family protein
LQRDAGKLQRRFSAGLVHNFQVAPTHSAPPASAEGLHARFFGGEAAGVAFEFVLVTFAVRNLLRSVEALQNGRAMPRERGFNAIDFRNVQTEPDDQVHLSSANMRDARDGDYTYMTVASPKRAKKAAAARTSPAGTKAAREWKTRKAQGLQILEAPVFSRLKWLVHGFSTRSGGSSRLERTDRGIKTLEQVLNLGFNEWDEPERVSANRQKFFSAIGAGKMRPVLLRQIHSDIVHPVGAAGMPQGEHAPPGDALITCERGVLLAVQTADCIPILLADTKNHAVAAIHSGWRGTAQRIAEKTLGRMQMEFGTRPQDVIAAIGPGIGQCCYEVGHEVIKEFAATFPAAREWFHGPFDTLENGDADSNWLPWLTMRPPGHAPPAPTAKLDLVAANRAILAGAGVPLKNITSSNLCTACPPDLFFSYRRERITGRMMAAIGIK